MSNLPPQLGDIPYQSEFQVPTLNYSSTNGTTTTTRAPTVPAAPFAPFAPIAPAANGSATTDSAKSTLINAKDIMTASMIHLEWHYQFTKISLSDTQQAAASISNHPVTQNVKETFNNAPVTEVAKDQAAKTSAEFDNLKNSRKTPETTLSNNQPLTHYHSFFYTLLSWENPRVTSIAFAFSILAIFAFRYVPALRLLFKSLYLVLGTVAVVEGVSKLVLGTGVAQSMRPKRYVTIPRDSLESSLEDVEQLLNFFVIEFQRILYAENVFHTSLAFLASFISYYLIKLIPTWGLLLIGTSLAFSLPLIYITNREAIDQGLASANQVVSAQAKQVRNIASKQTSNAASTVKSYAGDYTAKAQGLVNKTSTHTTQAPTTTTSSTIPQNSFKAQDFPVAPRKDPIIHEVAEARPMVI